MNSQETGEFVSTCFVWSKSVTLKCKHPLTVRNVGYVKRITRLKIDLRQNEVSEAKSWETLLVDHRKCLGTKGHWKCMEASK